LEKAPMTLIITIEASKHVVATADGRSKGMIESNALQKIFPLPNKGFAIAHHGQNLIEGRMVQDIINEFFTNNLLKIGKSSIQTLAQLFEQKYGKLIIRTLNNIPSNQVCGLLFLGFAHTTNKPKIYETFWEKRKDAVSIKKHTDLVLSGEAKKFIKKYIEDPKEKEFRRRKVFKGISRMPKGTLIDYTPLQERPNLKLVKTFLADINISW
jgi:hypothetical protein